MSSPQTIAAPLRRDRYTITTYGTFAVWGWFLYSFSPSVPLLAEDLGVSKAAGGLHGTAMALGAISAALFTPRLVAAIGRRNAITSGLLLVAAGVAGLVAGPVLAATLGSMFVLAVGGNVAVSASQVGISDHHGPSAPAAITEANGVGSGVGLFAPLAVGLAVGVGWGWRAAVVTTVVLAVAVAWATSRLPDSGRRTPDPTAPTHERADAAGTPGAVAPTRALGPGSVWFLVTLVAAVALENATTYWSTSLVLERTGADESIATATTAGLIAGMTAMRFVVGPLTRRWHSAHLLAVSFGISVVGWAVLWTATSPAVALVGLAVAGFGYGAQYPLSVALVLGIAREAADRAQAVATFTGGAAVGLAPFILGAVADAVGMHTAFLAVPVLAVLGGTAAVLGWRRAHAHALL